VKQLEFEKFLMYLKVGVVVTLVPVVGVVPAPDRMLSLSLYP
jgi:hypothetical protein